MATQADARLQRSAPATRFTEVRALSTKLAAPLSDADATIQPHPDASPAKWHLAHTTWFFETFVLRDHVPGYRLFDQAWAYLFNSYYDGEGARQPRHRRGMMSRPTLEQICNYRAHVDAALVQAFAGLPKEVRDLVQLGMQHEQQHQELLLMDMLATFAENPLAPAMFAPAPAVAAVAPAPISGQNGAAGIVEIGASPDGFAFDSERPRHQVLLHPHQIADRLVTNGDWIRFIDDGGYCTSGHWLSDGWAWVQAEAVEAPLYWRPESKGWARFGLDGLRPLDPAEPVCHISYYEADAFARWAGARLPTEAEWEAAAAGSDPGSGNQLDQAGPAHPRPAPSTPGLKQMFGDVWQWTASAFLPYPGFKPAEGTVGEYNGKFMSGQFVLKGASCATPRGHSRASYRNFFYPHQRWQFAGVRLARDL